MHELRDAMHKSRVATATPFACLPRAGRESNPVRNLCFPTIIFFREKQLLPSAELRLKVTHMPFAAHCRLLRVNRGVAGGSIAELRVRAMYVCKPEVFARKAKRADARVCSLGSWIFSVCLGDGSRGSLGSSIFLDVLNDGARGSSIL